MDHFQSLAVSTWSGTINGITLYWRQKGISDLPLNAVILGVSEGTLKALTEHFAIEVATEIGNSRVTIISSAHKFSIQSATGKRVPDHLHITIETSGQPLGGTSKFENMYVDGRTVLKRTRDGFALEPSQCTGNYSLAAPPMTKPATSGR